MTTIMTTTMTTQPSSRELFPVHFSQKCKQEKSMDIFDPTSLYTLWVVDVLVLIEDIN
jgi:hypothetical protein